MMTADRKAAPPDHEAATDVAATTLPKEGA